MPLEILGPVIVIALFMVIMLVHLTNKNKPVSLLDEAAARDFFAVQHPSFDVEEVIVSDDGMSAFLCSKVGQDIGLVHKMGQSRLSRLLNAENLVRFQLSDSEIMLRLSDFTLSCMIIPVSHQEHRLRLEKAFAGLEV